MQTSFVALGMVTVLSLAQLSFTSCVTINVNFPEGAAQKASDDFVKELYRARERSQEATPPKKSAWWEGLLIAEAYAADSFQIKSAKTSAIQAKMRARLDELLAHKRSGVIGEDNVGLLIIKDETAVKPMLKKKIESLVGGENSDRAELYAEVAVLNGLKPAQMPDIGRTFAHSFQAESPSGTWVQSDKGDWRRKN